MCSHSPKLKRQRIVDPNAGRDISSQTPAHELIYITDSDDEEEETHIVKRQKTNSDVKNEVWADRVFDNADQWPFLALQHYEFGNFQLDSMQYSFPRVLVCLKSTEGETRQLEGFIFGPIVELSKHETSSKYEAVAPSDWVFKTFTKLVDGTLFESRKLGFSS